MFFVIILGTVAKVNQHGKAMQEGKYLIIDSFKVATNIETFTFFIFKSNIVNVFPSSKSFGS